MSRDLDEIELGRRVGLYLYIDNVLSPNARRVALGVRCEDVSKEGTIRVLKMA